MPHLTVCHRDIRGLDTLPMGNFVHLLVYDESAAMLCPHCIDHIDSMIRRWRTVTGHAYPAEWT
jgi:hypothetical protein